MAENQEQIESRLCGYVEETLGPAEKAEIEAHLQAHPQQRQLLLELRKMREALAALPRESAPGEMSDSFTGQLERSVLLDGMDQQPAEPRMRITRMPQFAAIAAIVLLAVGLGFVVLYAWPSFKSPIAQNTRTPAAIPSLQDGEGSPKPAPSPIAPADLPKEKPQVTETAPPTGPVFPNANVISRTGDAVENASGHSQFADANANPQMAAIVNSALANNSVRALLGRTEQDRDKAGNRPTLVMVVATADPDAATRKLGNYLESNNADWQSAPASAAIAKASPPAFGNIAGRPTTPVAGSLGASLRASGGASAAPGGAGGGEMKLAPSTMPQSTHPDAFASANGPGAPGPTTGPNDLEQQTRLASNGQRDGYRPIESFKDLKNQFAGTNDRLYVVRNLSFQQATQLSDMLRQGGRGGKQSEAPLFADRAEDGATDVKLSAQTMQMQRMSLAPAADATPATHPATEPQGADQRDQLDEANKLARSPAPDTNPATPTAAAIAPINNQALLGSSPVDLVIVIQNAPAAEAVPTTAPAVVPATNPATEPTTAPQAMPVTPPIAD